MHKLGLTDGMLRTRIISGLKEKPESHENAE